MARRLHKGNPVTRTQLHIVFVLIAALAASSEAASKRKRNRGVHAKATKVVTTEPPAKQLDARTTLEAVTLRKRPGERQPAAGKLAAGTEIVVEAEQERWLRVRAGGITGYVTRTTVSAPRVTRTAAATQDMRSQSSHETVESGEQLAATAAVDVDGPRPTSWRTTRELATTKATSTALFATVTVRSSVVRTEPVATSDEVATLSEGTRVTVMEARSTPGWIQVRDADDQVGWIAQSELGNGHDMVTAAAGEPPARLLDAAATATVAADEDHHQRWSLHLAAGAGYRALASQIESSGGTQQLAGRASVARVDLDTAAYALPSIFVGVDAHLEVGRSAVELDGAGAGAVHGTRGLAAGVRVGVRPRGIAELSLRAGTRRESVKVIEGEGAEEQLSGTTLGVRVDVKPSRSRLAARLEVDSLVAGTWQQGEGAMQRPARAQWAGMTIGVRIIGAVSLHATFELAHASTVWTDTATAEPASTRRIDTSQLLQVGLSGAL